ncbi:MAG: right-handed parallel beta-helix repeat-containing protein [Methanotrichaceae archaeon]|nr:right-handed parallel beta-helix repeat-containing protein [Methanotrichaceae archaeon]
MFFLIDGEVKAECTSSNGEYIDEIPEGVHKLTWTLSKKTGDNGGITGWINKICITSPTPNCTIEANEWEVVSHPATASVPFAGAGAQYSWSIAGGTVESGNGTPSITWSYPRAGLANISVTITRNGTSSSCSKLVNVWECSITAPDNAAPNSINTASVPEAGSDAGYYWLIEGGAAISGQTERNFTWRAGEGESVVLIATVTINGIPYHCSKTVYTTGECRIIAPEQVVAGTTFEARLDYSGQWGTLEWSIDGDRIPAGQGTNRITWAADWPGQMVISVTIPRTNIRCSKTVTVLPNCNITAPKAACALQPNLTAKVKNAGPGASYTWSISGGEPLRGQGTPRIEWKAGRREADTISVDVRANETVNNGTWSVPINQSCVYLTYCDDLQGEIESAKDPMEIILTCEPCGSQSAYGPIEIEGKDNLTIRSKCMAKIDGNDAYAAVTLGNSSNVLLDSLDITHSKGSGLYAEVCPFVEMVGMNITLRGEKNQMISSTSIHRGLQLIRCNDSIISNSNITVGPKLKLSGIFIIGSLNVSISNTRIESPNTSAIHVKNSDGICINNSLDDDDMFNEVKGQSNILCCLFNDNEYICCSDQKPIDIMKGTEYSKLEDLRNRVFSNISCSDVY